MTLQVQWLDDRRAPQCQPDPAYPNGRDFDISGGAPSSCHTTLTYPAKRCGKYVVKCLVCKQSALITTAGRADDPRSIRMACNKAIAGAAPAPPLKPSSEGGI